MVQPETKLKRKLDQGFVNLFGKVGSDSFHTSIEKGPGQKSGLPDRFYAALGGHAWVEAKVLPNKLSQLQALTCARLARAGCRVVLAYLEQRGDTEFFLRPYDPIGHQQPSICFNYRDTATAEFWRTLFNLKGGRA